MIQNCEFNIRVEDIAPGFERLSSRRIASLIPDRESYREATVFEGKHGEFHVPRLILLIHVAAQILQLSDVDRAELIAASYIHDSRRRYDNERDKYHGHEGAGWWAGNMHLLRHKGIYLNSEQEGTALRVAKYHETRAEDIPFGEFNENSMRLLNIFKVIDALDRFRDSDSERHIDYNRFDPDMKNLALTLAPLALVLAQFTEKARQEGMDVQKAIYYVGAGLGFIE